MSWYWESAALLLSRMGASPARVAGRRERAGHVLRRDPSRAEIATLARLSAAPAALYVFAAVLAYGAFAAA